MRGKISLARRDRLHAQFQDCAREMKRLGELFDRAGFPRKLKILDRMTDLMNRGMDLLERARGGRWTPVKLRLSGRRPSRRRSRPA